MGACTRINPDGIEYDEFSCLYTFLGASYFEFETKYNGKAVSHWIHDHPHVPILTTIGYMVCVYLLQRYFEQRSAWPVRPALIVWNVLLCVFSTMGTLRSLPLLYAQVFVTNHTPRKIDDRIIISNVPDYFHGGSTLLWLHLFTLSKYPELVDTLFLVCRKKPVIFLHWYHHVTVLLYCWLSYVSQAPTSILFGSMNFTVHAVMYGYYALMAAKWRPKWFHPIYITTLQIAQMVVGCAATVVAAYYYWTEESCALTSHISIAACTMYGSYLCLFAHFFVSRYHVRVQSEGTSPTKKRL